MPEFRDGGAGGEEAVIPRRVLLIHGYSADGKEFLAWKEALAGAGTEREPTPLQAVSDLFGFLGRGL